MLFKIFEQIARFIAVSFLQHLIKNPQVISVIMGLDNISSVPDLKLTRSKTKHLPGQGSVSHK